MVCRIYRTILAIPSHSVRSDLLTHLSIFSLCGHGHVSRDGVKQAEIIFMPYNYLVDPEIRAVMRVPLKNSIIIFDEAHNIEGLACCRLTVDILGLCCRNAHITTLLFAWICCVIAGPCILN